MTAQWVDASAAQADERNECTIGQSTSTMLASQNIISVELCTAMPSHAEPMQSLVQPSPAISSQGPVIISINQTFTPPAVLPSQSPAKAQPKPSQSTAEPANPVEQPGPGMLCTYRGRGCAVIRPQGLSIRTI
ncbi:hypothetical protein ACMFMG_008377 [Clarireedia jacksonii]